MRLEYTEDGKKVIIPVEIWKEVEDLLEFFEIHELIEERKNSKVSCTLDDLLKEEGLTRENLQD